jgi:F-type H+-transporting ATPase subunit delta
MSTFIGQLIGFAVIVAIIMRWVVPPVRRLMAEQRQAVRNQLDESAKASQRLAAADTHHAERVEAARAEAGHIVDEARSDAVRIEEQLRVQSGVEAERIRTQGGGQVSLLRAQLIRQLRGDLGSESVQRAAELVRAHVADPQAQSATVDRFIDELDAMSATAFAAEVSSSDLRSASRDAQAAVVERLRSVTGSLSGDELSRLSDELASVAGLLQNEPILARHLAGATGDADAKKQLLTRLLNGRVGSHTLEVLDAAVSVRWSQTPDLVEAIQHAARLSLLARADREYQTEEVAEQLFRFSRILEEQPQLANLLGDYSTPAEKRVSLLRSVLSGASGANTTAEALLRQTVELLHGERADAAVQDLAELAVSNRGEVVAEVSAAAELSHSQRTRLTEVLTRIYHHPVSVQINVDPELLGGLAVAVGDEVIDGTLSSRLAAAATKLPD